VAQRSDEIKQHIDRERQRLGSNIREIESRVKRSTDWRSAFEKNPWMLLGAAAAGGLILAGVVGSSRPSEHEDPSSHTVVPSKHMQQISDTIDGIVGALISLGTSKVKEFVGGAVPGFAEEYEKLHHGNV
jgi:hypothetical protein